MNFDLPDVSLLQHRVGFTFTAEPRVGGVYVNLGKRPVRILRLHRIHPNIVSGSASCRSLSKKVRARWVGAMNSLYALCEVIAKCVLHWVRYARAPKS